MISKEDKLKLLVFYKKGLEFYMKKEFDKASDYFSKCLEIDPDDGPSKVYLDRCKEYIVTPPPQDWDGVFEMKSK
jgi:tetratricopeptide (TPR) repeat protein